MDATAYPHPIGPAWMDENGYWRICIRGKDGRWKTRYLHRLIYEQAHGPIPPGHDIHHLDEDKANCSLSNLRSLPREAHMSWHKLGTRPSHVVLPDGSMGKRCRICDRVKPLQDMTAYTTPTGGRAYKPHCRRCHYRTYGWGKWLREQQP